MGIKSKKRSKQFVNHPLYGDKPRYTNNKYSLNEIVQSFWQYNENEIIIGTTIDADISRQNYSVIPISIYVDLMKTCTECRRQFIFYAKEQQYWFEELGFFVDSDCKRCVECRKSERTLKMLVKEYEALLGSNSRSENEESQLSKVALQLFQIGYIKNPSKIKTNNSS